MQRAAMGDAMRCVGTCIVLRFLPRLCALFVICRPSALPNPFLLSRQLSSCLFSIPFPSFINFLSFSLRSFLKRNAARCISPRSIPVFPFLTDGVGQALLCMRGLMAFRLPGDSLQRPPAFHSPAFCRLYICSTLSASTGLSVVMKLIPQLVISAIVGISLTVHTLVVMPLARATPVQVGLLR